MRIDEATPDGSVREMTAATPLLSEAALSKLLFFTAAGLSFLLSIYLFFTGDRERGIFVGLWVPSILSAGALLQTGGRHDR
jgi:hypothetical protein